jgi:hypothetical protein
MLLNKLQITPFLAHENVYMSSGMTETFSFRLPVGYFVEDGGNGRACFVNVAGN